MKYFSKFLMGNKICSIFLILFFKLRESETKRSKLTVEEIEERQSMLNKSHQLSRYKTNVDKNQKKKLIHLDPDDMVFNP